MHYGTDAQKQHYLPRLAGGQEIPCFRSDIAGRQAQMPALFQTKALCAKANGRAKKYWA